MRYPGLVLVVLILGGCGFHLAGQRPLPPALQSVYIDLVDQYRVAEPPLETALRARLLRRGADVMASARNANAILLLEDLTEDRRVLSVGPDGKAVEFQLVTRVRYQLDRDGQTLIPPAEIRVAREYSFNAEQILAKEAEEERLRAFIQDELAELLLLRVEASLSRLSAVAPAN